MEGNVSMLWVVVICVGVFLVVMSLCKVSGISDEQNDNMYQTMYRGDNDGDN